MVNPTQDPSDLIEQHVKDNYRARAEAGESYAAMADEAERMNDTTLAAHLRKQGGADERGKSQDRTTQPQGRTAAAPAKQNAEGRK
jgi:rubrerythrin